VSGGGNEWMPVGWLNQQLVFKTAVETQSESGAMSISWADSFTCFGAHRDLKGREREVYGQEISEALAVFVIRYLAGTPAVNGSITWRGADWEIMAPPVELGNKQGWQVYAKRRRADAVG